MLTKKGVKEGQIEIKKKSGPKTTANIPHVGILGDGKKAGGEPIHRRSNFAKAAGPEKGIGAVDYEPSNW